MRKHERYAIESPVTVGASGSVGTSGSQVGRLCDIGVRGARICMDHPLPAHIPVTLLAHFRDPQERVVTVRFEGVITRARQAPPYEFAVRFRKSARFMLTSPAEGAQEPHHPLRPASANPRGGIQPA